MPNLPRCELNAGPERFIFGWLAAAMIALLAGCTQPPQQTPVAAATPPPAPPPPVQPVPFPAAVTNAADAVFAGALAHGQQGGQKQIVVIDPLVNGVTGEQTAATQQIQERIVALAREKYPQFDVEPFTAQAVRSGPNVMVGTFTPINAQGQTTGTREAYRFCLVMVDLRTGKTIAKGVARAQMDGIDPTPISFFRDSPAWTHDANIKSYIDTCQATKVGDPISQTYLNGILTASVIAEAIDAYDANRYSDALALYESAQQMPAGNQLRVYNGLYLTNWKLGQQAAATDAFGRLVDYGLDNNALGMKILFRPSSTAFEPGGPYEMWLRQIATHSASRNVCLQVTGNSSPTGSAALNEQLSLLRAEYVKRVLEVDAPMDDHIIATGEGATNNLIGTGADDLSDALDRRVDFKVIPAC
jgi:outer membrane protein OmpA-like peptidoglycan-associated protein